MLIRHSGLDPFHMPPVLSSIHQLNQQPRPFFYGGGDPFESTRLFNIAFVLDCALFTLTDSIKLYKIFSYSDGGCIECALFKGSMKYRQVGVMMLSSYCPDDVL